MPFVMWPDSPSGRGFTLHLILGDACDCFCQESTGKVMLYDYRAESWQWYSFFWVHRTTWAWSLVTILRSLTTWDHHALRKPHHMRGHQWVLWSVALIFCQPRDFSHRCESRTRFMISLQQSSLPAEIPVTVKSHQVSPLCPDWSFKPWNPLKS